MKALAIPLASAAFACLIVALVMGSALVGAVDGPQRDKTAGTIYIVFSVLEFVGFWLTLCLPPELRVRANRDSTPLLRNGGIIRLRVLEVGDRYGTGVVRL